MAVRIEELQRNDLLHRYLVASWRHAAAQPRPRAGSDLMLARYIRAMERLGMVADPTTADDVRTCAHCGQRTHFNQDPSGGWAVCSVCDELA